MEEETSTTPDTTANEQASEPIQTAEVTTDVDNQDTNKDTNKDDAESKAPAAKDDDKAKDVSKVTTDDSNDKDETNDNDADSDDDGLTDSELEALDSKVRSKLSKKNREAANLRERVKSETARADRAEVALALGLNADEASFLTGNTREELEEQGEKLLVMLGTKTRVTPTGLPKENGKVTQGNDHEPSLDEIGSRMFKR